MCMWSDIPPNFYGNGIQTAYYAADILEYAWQVFAAHISAIVLYMKIMCMSIFTNELAMIILVVSVALSGLYL